MGALGNIAACVGERVAPGQGVVERLAPTTREEWLALRRETIGASEAACLLGIHPYTTTYEMFALKSGLIDSDPTETPAMRRGRLLEDDALQIIGEERPNWTLTPNPIPGGLFYRDMAQRISATPDCFAVDPARPGKGVIQVKSLEPSIYRKTWKQEDGSIEPPLHVAVQATIEAAMSGCTWAAAAALVVSFGMDVKLVEVPLIPGLWERIRSEVAAFWRAVDANMPPDPDYSRDGSLIVEIFGQGDGTTIDLSGENHLPEILSEDERLREEIATAKARRDEIKAEIVHKLAGSTFATVPGWRVSNKTQTRKAHEVKESTFAVLRTSRVGF